jgi:hypothetical protein
LGRISSAPTNAVVFHNQCRSIISVPRDIHADVAAPVVGIGVLISVRDQFPDDDADGDGLVGRDLDGIGSKPDPVFAAAIERIALMIESDAC